MGWTNDLKQSIYSQLNAILTTHEAGTEGEDPGDLYCLYALPSTNRGNRDNKESKTKVLQVDVWYTNADHDKTGMNNVCDSIETALDEESIICVGFYYDSFMITKQDSLPTANENTFHVQFRFELHYNQYDYNS